MHDGGKYLAVAGDAGVTVFQSSGEKGESRSFVQRSRQNVPDLPWQEVTALPQPRGVPINDAAQVTSLSWMQSSTTSLMVSYALHGIMYGCPIF